VWLDHGQVKASGDVLRVADAYYKHVLQHGSSRGTPANGDGRYGSGEARVVRVELLDGAGRPMDVALTNHTIIVRMHYQARERIDHPVFGLAIHDALTGAHLAGPNNRLAHTDIASIEGDGHVDYRIERLPFLPGEYNIRTALFDASITHQYDAWLDCAQLKVAPGGTNERHGLIALEGQWSYAAAPSGMNASITAEADHASASTSEAGEQRIAVGPNG
jgi:hypothetical protein